MSGETRDPVRIGFVGTGSMGQCAHLRNYALIPACEVVAIAELREQTGKHIDSRKRSNVERGTTWLLGRASLIGPHTARWAREMLEVRGIQGVRVLVGLRSLTGRYRDAQIEQACEIALTHNAFRLRAIRELIKRGGVKQASFEFLSQHEIIRDLSDYGDLVGRAFQAPASLPPRGLDATPHVGEGAAEAAELQGPAVTDGQAGSKGPEYEENVV